MKLLPIVLFAALACRSDKQDDTISQIDTGTTAGPVDADGDGYAEDVDCDDGDASVHPDAAEVCDEVDNNCDGAVDEGVQGTFYADADGDGFGDDAQAVTACSQPEGTAAVGGDCDDLVADANPGATEVCDEVDNNCDGAVDEGVQGTFYVDADGDGFGDESAPVQACDAPSGATTQGGDCDDTDATVSPVATEVCDGVDDNCDGTVDEATAVDASEWYADADGDGYGDAATAATACEAPSGYVADDTDCDDASASVNPSAAEVCDGVDDDCDGLVDDADPGLTDGATFYLDYDGDGYGADRVTATACSAPSGYVSDDTDCDDLDADANPGETEVCDGVDNNCDGDVDEDSASDATAWYLDADGDGYGDAASTTTTCEAPSGYVADDTDCDDTDDSIHPDAEEVCDDIDQDCDGDDGLSSCEDCAAILAADSSSTDGVYTIDIDGTGGTDPFEVYCDMTLDGGGWTQWWWHESTASLSGVTDVLGDDLWDCDPSADDQCTAALPISDPDELLVLNQTGDWAVWEFDSTSTTSNNILAAFTTQTTVSNSSSVACNDAWTPVAQDGTMTDDPYVCDENNNADPGCDCFWYTSYSGVYSFYLDDDTGWAETAFAAGYDGSGTLGVDSLETSYRYNSESYELWMYWR